MIRWGIIGLGNIAIRFAKSLEHSKQGKLAAIASRTAEKREQYVNLYPGIKAYESYDDIIQDPDIDAVYVALPHGFHKEWVLKALQCHKAVLCEKPVGLNQQEMEEIKACALKHQTFFMEALKTRFVPLMDEIKAELKKGIIGKIQSVEASFCYDVRGLPRRKGWYLFEKDQGGALLDVGPYPVSFVLDLLETPITKIESEMVYDEEGIDHHFIGKLYFEDGAIGIVEGAIDGMKERTAHIVGTLGTMEVPVYNRPLEYTIKLSDGQVIHQEQALEVDDMFGEIEEVHRCLKEGLLESPRYSFEDSLKEMKVMDDIRQFAK